MNRVLCDAIEQRRILRFGYDGVIRLVEPHAYGVSSKGTEVLRAWQRDAGWRLFSLAKMGGLEVLEENFEGPRPGYRARDSHMDRIFCAL